MSTQKTKGARRPILLARLPKKHFGAVLADPPWHFKTFTNEVGDRDPRNHYGVMSLDDIKALPVAQHAAPDSHLFLCGTWPMLAEALDVMNAWGFRYSGVAFVWAKLRRGFRSPFVIPRFMESDFHVGLGYTTRKNTEFVLLGRRGSPNRQAMNVRELIIAPVREHSRKPDEIRERIERYCVGPYLELFGRQRRKGWTVRGDEVGKFGGSGAA